jgi:signal peptidase I
MARPAHGVKPQGMAEAPQRLQQPAQPVTLPRLWPPEETMSQPRPQTASPAPKPLIPEDPAKRKRFHSELLERCKYLDESGGRLLRKRKKQLAPDVAAVLETQWQTLHDLLARKSKDTHALLQAAEPFDEALDMHLGKWRKSATREYVDSIVWALVLTLLIRAFVFEAFKIPTGSMIPTLQVHDHLFVNKFLYGLKIPFTRVRFLTFRQPHRGEIVVFEYPYDDGSDSFGKDLIKRVVGVPGDRIRLVNNVLQINGKPVPRKIIGEDADCGQIGSGARCEQARECMDGIVYTTQHFTARGRPDWPDMGADDQGSIPKIYSLPLNKDFPDFVVPEGFVLGMGDNRDNSQDSRFFGLIPLDTIKGKAGVLWFATKDQNCEWLCAPDFSRMFTLVHETTPGGTCDNF